jgi:monofunctional biosynthetic peptidoglycan transglycosylase
MLCAAFMLLVFGLVEMSLPNLDGVENGVTIKIKSEGKKSHKKFISPDSDEFVHSRTLPGYVAGAIITSEDEDFFKHNGINVNEMLEAAEYDIKHFNLKCGGSTITQQVVKNIYLSGEKSFSRKFIEAVTAIRLEKKLSKRQILDYYLNIAEFGDGIYGIRQASYYYFDKEPGDMTPREAATLAVLMPKPKVRGKALITGKTTKFQKRRIANLLDRMKEEGYIHSDGV